MGDTPRKILIIEDDDAFAQVLKDRLENEGFTVLLAKDGANGLLVALDKQPDLILLDIAMPKLDGISMLKRLRQYDKGKDLRVVMLTSVNDTKQVHEALSLGARDFLVKSDWVISDLVESIRGQFRSASLPDG